LVIDDYPKPGWVLGRIEKEKPDLLILNLDFPEVSTLQMLQEIRRSKPLLPICICSDTATEQFENQASQLGGPVFFSKAGGEGILDQIEKLSQNNQGKGAGCSL